MRSRNITAPAAFLVAGILLTGCAASAGQGSSADSAVVGISDQPANLDFTTTDGAAIPWILLDNVYEGLVSLDDDGAIVPKLAQSWTVSEDGTVYNFTLQDGVTFSNGSPFNAESVAFSIDRVKNDWTTGQKAMMDVVESVTPVSETEVQVTLSAPDTNWLFQMTTRLGAMFSPDGVDDLANTPVATGPYEVSSFSRGDSVVLSRRDDYWGTEPALAEVTFQSFTDSNSESSALLSGSIDAIDTLQTLDTISQFESSDEFEINKGVTNSEMTLSMNNAAGIFTDLRVRQAVEYAIDRESLVDSVTAGYGTLIGSMVPPTDPWYEDLSDTYTYDPARAEQLIADAGVAGQTVRFRIPSLPSVQAAAQVVQSDLTAVGLDVQIETLDFPAVWLEQVYTNKDYDLSIINHVEPRDIANYADPDYYWGYDSPEFQALWAQGSSAATEEESVAAYKQAAKLLADDAVSDWLYLEPRISVTDSGLSGYPKNQVGESINITGLSWAE